MAIDNSRVRRKSFINSVTIILFIITTSILDIHHIQFKSNLIKYLYHFITWGAFFFVVKYLVKQNSLLDKFERNIKISNIAMDQSPNFIVLTNLVGEVIFANQRLINFTKINYEIVTSKTIGEIFPYPDATDINDIYKRIKDGKEWQGDLKGYTLNQEPYWFRVNGFPILQENEDTTILIIAVDVTEQTLAEMALKESEQKYRELFNKAIDAIFLQPFSTDGTPQTFEDVNEVTCAKLGYSREELLRLTCYDICNINEYDDFEGIAKDIKNDGHATFERHLITKENQKIPFELNSHKVRFNNQDYILTIARDITRRNKRKQALIESEVKYRELFNKATDAIFLNTISNEGLPQPFEDVNEVACIKLGYSREEMLRLTSLDISSLHEDYDILALIKDIEKNGNTTFECDVISKDKKRIPFEMNAHKIILNNQEYILTIARDITRRKERQQALIESEVKYRELFNSANDCIFLQKFCDDFRYIDVNKVACDKLGYSKEELLNFTYKDMNKLSDNRIWDVIYNSLLKHGKATVTANLLAKDARKIPFEINSHIIQINNKDFILTIARDVTERHDAERALKVSEKKYYELFHNSPAVKIIIDPTNARILDANQAASDFYGYNKDELLSMDFSDFNVISKETFHSNILKVIESNKAKTFNLVHKLANGELRDVEVYTCKIQINGRTLLHSITIDVTQRKMAERALKISEGKYRTLFENANDAIYLYEVKDDGTVGKLIEVNSVVCDRLGYSREELLAMTPLDLCIKEQVEDSKEIIREIVKTKHINFERIHVTKDGRKIPVEVNAHNFELNGKKVNLSIARDITERKRAEETLRLSSKKYSDLFNNSPAVKVILNPANGKIVDVNQAAVNFYGYSKEQLLKMNIYEINTRPKDVVLTGLQDAFKTNFSQTFNFVHRLANGELRDVEVYSGAIKIDNQTFLHATVIDVTKRKRAEKALKISEEKYRTLFENANDAIFLYEVKEDLTIGNFLDVNTVACNRLGYSRDELLSMSLKDINVEESINENIDALKVLYNKGHITYPRTYLTKDGRKISVEISAHQFELNGQKVNLSIARDITERKRTEKLALLGELSTGVAHEIKNPLAIIRGYTEYLQSEDGLTQDTKESLQYIINTVDRLDKVINSFLRFSQPVDYKLVPVDVVSVIKEAINFIKPTANKKNVRIDMEFMSYLPKWYLDPDLITQVFLNLLLNSLDVMYHGKILIKVFYDEANQVNKIIFRDDGPGIPKSNQSKIFEPFFTTKKAGSGLGLSIVANLVRNMYGTIEVDSDEGCGTTFILSFPVIDSRDLYY